MEIGCYALALLAISMNSISVTYALASILRVKIFQPRRRPTGDFRPPVTVLKPVCGVDEGLLENLRSFCTQDYPEYQIVFGVRYATDPAIPVIESIITEFPSVDLLIVIDETITGPNLKVGNLNNIYRSARHSCLIIADSDMRVDDQYLSSVVAPLSDDRVGVVTCLYSATPAGGIPSVLASMFINEYFLPSVLVSAAFREVRFGLGATIVVRRNLLDEIGGFTKLSQFLADDHMLGKLISDRGFKVVLSDYVVENIVREENLRSMFLHELRWARTVRTVEPLGHAFSFIMHGIPMAVFGAATVEFAMGWHVIALALVGLGVFMRGWMHYTIRRKLGLEYGIRSFWLVPLRDVLNFAVWAASFCSREIVWKNIAFTVSSDGQMTGTESCKR